MSNPLFVKILTFVVDAKQDLHVYNLLGTTFDYIIEVKDDVLSLTVSFPTKFESVYFDVNSDEIEAEAVLAKIDEAREYFRNKLLSRTLHQKKQL